MSHRPWSGFVAVAAMLVVGCTSPGGKPPETPPPSAPSHVCLEIWGQAAQGLKDALDAVRNEPDKNRHRGWANRANPCPWDFA